eukprot:gb/GEZN01000748.1/.p1 GENE.gb/GEZN01000748.1/~~gb/GEZN01000748.1/.p1  ORF type:complete len:1063 (-),score=82.18 gb/GEZN01000748.1/:511-3699(-)
MWHKENWSGGLLGGDGNATPPPSRPSRYPPRVFCVWDLESCSVPSNMPVFVAVQKLIALASRLGIPERPVAVCRQGSVSPETRRLLRESQVVIEEIFSQELEAVHIFIATHILSVSLKLAAKPKGSPGESGHRGDRSALADDSVDTNGATMIIIANNRHLAQAITILRRSGLFSSVLLLHLPDVSRYLVSCATTALDWTTFLGCPKSESSSPATGHVGLRQREGVFRSFSGGTRTAEHSSQAYDSPNFPDSGRTSAVGSNFSSPSLHGFAMSSSSEIIDDMSLGPSESSSASAYVTPRAFTAGDWTSSISDQLKEPFRRLSIDSAPSDSKSGLFRGEDSLAEFRSFLARALDQPGPASTCQSAEGTPRGATYSTSYATPRPREEDGVSPARSNRDTEFSFPTRMAQDYSAPGSKREADYSGLLPRAMLPKTSVATPHEGKWDLRRNSAPAITMPTTGKSAFGSDRSTSPQMSPRESPPGSRSPSTPRARTLAAFREKQNLGESSREGRPTLSARVDESSKLGSWRSDDSRLLKTKKIAVLLFQKVVQECQQERIIPRESVVRSRIENNLLPKSKKLKIAGLGNIKVPLRFDAWIEVLLEVGAVQIEGARPQRVLWPNTGRFECADYFRPEERLTEEQMQEVLAWFRRERPQVERGRYGLASYMKLKGPLFIQGMPRGFIVELVQLLLNKHVLVFRKGKVGYSPMGIDNLGDPESLPTSTNGMSEGPPLPSTIRRAMARLLVHVPQFSEEITDDPMGVLAFLCAHSQSEGLPTLAFRPMYHFEKSGLLHAPLWVCNVTVRIPGLGVASTAAWNESSRRSLIRVKRFKSIQRPRKGECMQEAALIALKAHFWLFAFNLVVAEIPDAVRKIREQELEPGEQSPLVYPSPRLDRVEDLEKTILPDAVGGPVVSPVELSARRQLSQSVLGGSLTQIQDPVFVLDQILVALDQKPAVYEVSGSSSTTVSRTYNRTDLMNCMVELQLRPRSNLFVFQGEGANDSGASFPLCKSTNRSSKLYNAKMEVANQIISQLRQAVRNFPIEFQDAKVALAHNASSGSLKLRASEL